MRHDSLSSGPDYLSRTRRGSSSTRGSFTSRRSVRATGAKDVVSDRVSNNGPLYEILVTGGTGTAVQVTMRKGDCVKAESDALISRSRYVDLKSRMEGGWMEALGRALVSNESFFLQTLVAERDDQDILLAPKETGDIVLLAVGGDEQYNIINGSFLCCDDEVSTEVQTQWDLEKATFGAGLFILRTRGTGTIAVNSTGSMLHYRLEAGDKRVVDNGHVVAWSSAMKYKVKMASKSIFTSITSGEGMMCYFEGPGDIYVQTHQPITISTSSGKNQKVRVSVGSGGPLIIKLAGMAMGFCIVMAILLVFGIVAYTAIKDPETIRSLERAHHGAHHGAHGRWRP